MRLVVALCAACLLAGCGVPQERADQAEDVHAVAAEGALLAHEAAEGSLETFTAEHAQALQGLLRELQPAIEDERLSRRAAAVDAALGRLIEDPGDRRQAYTVERRLRELAG